MNFYVSKYDRIAFFMIAMVVIVGGILCYWASASSGYVKVIDGDSLEIGRRRVRLQGIDAPEYVQYCYNSQRQRYRCGLRSRDYLADMIKTAHYQIDCHVIGYDRYRRELSECFAGNKNLNLEMVLNGWAVSYRADRKEYDLAEKQAQKTKKGIWRGKFMRPEYFRRLQREEKSHKS